VSLRLRVATATFFTTAVILALAGVALIALVARDERADLDRQLASQARLAVQAAAGVAPDKPRVVDTIPIERLVPNVNVVGRAREGDRVYLTIGDFPLPPDVPAALGYSTVRVDGERWRILAVKAEEIAPRLEALSRDGDANDVVIEVASPSSVANQRLRTITRQVLRLGLLGALLAAAVGWLLGGAALRPLARLRRDTERLTEAGEDARVSESQGLREVDELGRSLNVMLDRIQMANRQTEAALEASRSFAANAAHELRTPLTSIQANLDVLARNPDLPESERVVVIGELRDQQGRLLHLLEGLRLLARGDLTGSLPEDEVDFAQLVTEAAVAAGRRHPEATFELEVSDPLALRGWHEGLRVMVDNVVENAARHGHQPGKAARVRIALHATPTVRLVVDDSGPGIAADERALVLSRFGRGSTAAPGGSGLGLALAQQQARLHGGDLTLSTSPAGGLRVTVELPVTSG
jgi:two-component system, OmpR family, sensor histidine kinase PrrB